METHTHGRVSGRGRASERHMYKETLSCMDAVEPPVKLVYYVFERHLSNAAYVRDLLTSNVFRLMLPILIEWNEM